MMNLSATTTRRAIPVSTPSFLGNEEKYVADCMKTGWISSIGKYIGAFEEAFAQFCSVKHAVACSNGTTALHLALQASSIGPGDEVIVPTLTYIASVNAIQYCGATPVFIDSEPITMNLDVAQLPSRITSRTKAILVVHLYGHPVDMDPVMEIAHKHGLIVIEDAAEAHGALYKGGMAGSIGDIGTFSFFGNKIITTGEGGMVTTRHAAIADKIRQLRGQGMDLHRRYWFPIVGYNYRMTNIQAAIGLAQIEKIADHIAARHRVSGWYNYHLAGALPYLKLPFQFHWARHAFWMYTILLDEESRLNSEEFRELLGERGIETRPVFYPIHTQPPYLERNRYPVAESAAARGVSLPTHGQLTEEDVEYVAHNVIDICHRGACA